MSVAERPICGTVPAPERPLPEGIMARYAAREVLSARWEGDSVVVELSDVIVIHRPGRAVWAAWFDQLLDEWDRAAATAAATETSPAADATMTIPT